MGSLKIEHICKTYGKGENEVKALDDVSFTVPEGQMTAVVGASGSGKSTLLHILGGVDRPTSGKVFFGDQDVYALNNKDLAVFRRHQVGLIYQFYNLIPVLNAEENITLPAVMDGQKPEPEKVNALLELLGLTHRRKHLPSQLSGGQQQRVSIGRALFTAPDVILADEPTGNLDSKQTAEIIALLRKSNLERKQTMIIITHDEGIAQQCDRIITLSDGKIIRDELTGQGGGADV
ncbi:MAG: ABC transporter ATP-binding protein [Oscillospiraceae bacterium]|nr:ABC transporter ATP-binding protein [Oscillospiraceae bacterium]